MVEARRILVVVTDTSTLVEQLHAAKRHATAAPARIVAVFVRDDRLHRAASLSFTREITRVGGTVVDFTMQRAQQLSEESLGRAQRRLRELARQADLQLEEQRLKVRELLEQATRDAVLIASTSALEWPGLEELLDLDLEVKLVGPDPRTAD